MFEDMTYEKILSNVLSLIDDDIDKRQGSMVYDAVAPACAELANAYVSMDNILDNSFADTASRDYLILRARERGLEPYEATYATARGVFDTEIEIGSRFSIGEVVFRVDEKLSDYEYSMTCESLGTVGNKYFGTLIPIDYVTGLGSAVLTEILVPARDEEDTESFRKRYFQDLFGEAFGGNKADYLKHVKDIDGVGQVRVMRVDEDNSNVRVFILASDGLRPSSTLIQNVKNILDPSPSGYGLGTAPIGHMVDVMAPGQYNVNVKINYTLDSDADSDEVLAAVKEKISDYFDSLNANWENTVDGIELYSAYIIVEILGISGIKNVESLTINNLSYIKVNQSYTVKLGTVTIV